MPAEHRLVGVFHFTGLCRPRALPFNNGLTMKTSNTESLVFAFVDIVYSSDHPKADWYYAGHGLGLPQTCRRFRAIHS